jgi:type IV pilus assembly protein PilA
MKVKGMKQAGFSLVELMVVVGIIGILAAIAVPKLQQFTAKAKQSEAKGMLRSIYTFQESYIAENGAPSTSISTIGASSVTGKTYEVKGTSGSEITVTANTSNWSATVGLKTGVNVCAGDNLDNWTVNQTGNPQGSAPSCQ